MNSYSNTLEYTKSAIESVTSKPARRSGKGYRLQCPAHGGKNLNLWIADSDKRIILSCKSQHCDPKEIMEAAGLSIKDVFYEQLSPKQAKEYKTKVTKRRLVEELSHEMVIVTLWITDDSEGLYPRNGEDDRKRCKQAFQRVQKVLSYLEAKL